MVLWDFLHEKDTGDTYFPEVHDIYFFESH